MGMRPSAAGRAVDVLLALVFASFVAVQYNDPDPAVWMSLYGAAMLAFAWDAWRGVRWWAPLAVIAVALPWAAYLFSRVAGMPGFPSFGLGQGMISEAVEQTRELGGLTLVTVAMASLSLRARFRLSAARKPMSSAPHAV